MAQQAELFQQRAEVRLRETEQHLKETAQLRRKREKEMGLTVNLDIDSDQEDTMKSSKIAKEGTKSDRSGRISRTNPVILLRQELDTFSTRLKEMEMAKEGQDGTGRNVEDDSSSDEEEKGASNDESESSSRRKNNKTKTVGEGVGTPSTKTKTKDYSRTFNRLLVEKEGPRPFTFHEFGLPAQDTEPFESLLHALGQSLSLQRTKRTASRTARREDRGREGEEVQGKGKEREREERSGEVRDWVVDGLGERTKSFSINDFQRTQEVTKKGRGGLGGTGGGFKISQFRLPPVEVNWDASFFPDKKLLRSLYRIPCSDPSGKVIRGVAREEAQGVTPWVPPEKDRLLPPVSPRLCSHTFQRHLLDHLETTIERLQREYDALPANTQELQHRKANAGADLNNLKQERDAVKKSFGVL